MEFVKKDGATAVIAVSGRFDLIKMPQVMDELKRAYQMGCTKVLIDFEHTDYIDSSVENLMVSIRRRVRPENFSARNASGDVLAELQTARYDAWLTD